MIILTNKFKLINQPKIEIKNIWKFTKLYIKLANPEWLAKTAKF